MPRLSSRPNGTPWRFLLVGLLGLLPGSLIAAPERLHTIEPSEESGLPGYVAGMVGDGAAGVFAVDSGDGRLVHFTDGDARVVSLVEGESSAFDADRLGGIERLEDGRLAVTNAREGRVAVLRPDGTVLRRFADAGGAPGELDQPRGIAASSNGRLYIADRGNDRIAVYGVDGVFLHTFGNGVLDNPVSVAVDAGESVYVLDGEADGRILHFGHDGELLATSSARDLADQAGGELAFSAFARGPDGVLYVADRERGRVFVLEPDTGQLSESFGSRGAAAGQFERITAIAGLSGGRVAVADSESDKIEVYRVDVTGRTVDRRWLPTVGIDADVAPPCERGERVAADEFLCPLEETVERRDGAGKTLARYQAEDLDDVEAMAMNDGSVAIAHDRYLSVFDRGGAHRFTIGGYGDGDGEFKDPVGVAIGAGRVAVVDDAQDSLQVFTAQGVFLFALRNQDFGETIFDDPVAVATDPHGTLYVADAGLGDVAVFDQEGKSLYRLGGESGAGGVVLEDVHDLALDADGQLFVLGSTPDNESRVLVFNGPRLRFAFGAAEGGSGAVPDPVGIRVGAWPGTTVSVRGEDRGETYRYLQVPGRVTGVRVGGDRERVDVRWTPVPGRFVDHYRVYEAPATGGEFSLIQDVRRPLFDIPRGEAFSHRYRISAVTRSGREGPPSAVAVDRFGNALAAFHAGDLGRAESLLRAEYADSPDDPAILEWLGRTQLERGETDEAAQLFERLVAVADDPAAPRRLQIHALTEAGAYARAQSVIRRVIEADAADAGTWLRCGQVALALDDAIGAVDCLDRIPDEASEQREALFLLARAYAALDLPGEAVASLDRGVARAEDVPRAHARAGFVLRSLERHEAAAEHFRQALEGGHETPEVRLAYARSALALERYDTVNHMAVKLAGEAETEARGRYLRGLVAQARGEHPKAVIALGRATRTAPEFADAWLALAETYTVMERPDDAREALASAWAAEPDRFDVAAAYGRVLRAGDRHADAVEPLQTAHRLRRGDAALGRALADSLRRVGRYQAAGNAARAALEAAGAEVEAADEARLLLADIAHAQGRTARAVELLQAVATRRPDSADVQLSLGAVYLDTNVYERAEQALDRAATLAPDDDRPQRLLGDLYLERRLFDQAIAAYENAVDLEASSGNRGALQAAFAEKKRSLEFGANRPRVVLRDLQFEPVFAAAYKQYTDRALGQVELANVGEADYADLRLTFRIKGYMDFPTQHEIDELPAGTTRTIDLTAAFNNRLLEIDEDTGLQAEVALQYTADGREDAIRLTRPVTVYGKNAMLWGREHMVGAFVTPRDDALRDFVRRAMNEWRPDSGPVPERVMTAMTLFNTLSAHGIDYSVDPNSPFSEVEADRVDYIQFPRETLHLKTGDCDDLSVLLAAGLQNLGIETAVVGVPGHLFMMFDTGVAAAERERVSADPRQTVIRDGNVWMPIEATLLGASFTEAWAEGARKYREHAGSEALTVTSLEAAWADYAPVTLPPTDRRPALPTQAEVGPRIEREQRLLLEKSLERLTRPYRAMLASDPDDIDARLQIALLHGRYGLYRKALTGFAEVLADDPDNSAAFNNRGNVFLMRGELDRALETYRQAEDLAPNDVGIKANLALVHYRAGDIGVAREKFAEARRIDAGIEERHQRLASVLQN